MRTSAAKQGSPSSPNLSTLIDESSVLRTPFLWARAASDCRDAPSETGARAMDSRRERGGAGGVRSNKESSCADLA